MPSSKGGFYAVRKGRQTGIFDTWDECQEQVKGYAGAQYKKLTTLEEAKNFVLGNTSTNDSSYKEVIPREQTLVSPASTDTGNDRGWQVVFSDGACKGNGQTGSFAGIGVWWGRNDSRNLSERCPGDQTNNRAELIAIVRLLETSPVTKMPLLIKSDSQYSINCVQVWLPKWRRSSFLSSTGQPVKNAPLIRYLAALLEFRQRAGQNVKLEYVKGHAGVEGNEGADALAVRGCSLAPEPERDWDKLKEDLQYQSVSAPDVIDTPLAKQPVVLPATSMAVQIIVSNLQGALNARPDKSSTSPAQNRCSPIDTGLSERTSTSPSRTMTLPSRKMSSLPRETSLPPQAMPSSSRTMTSPSRTVTPASQTMTTSSHIPTFPQKELESQNKAKKSQVSIMLDEEELKAYAACLLDDKRLRRMGETQTFDSDY